MKRRKWLLLVLVFLLPTLWFALRPGREEQTLRQFTRDREVLEELAQLTLEQGNSDGIVPPAPWQGVELYRSGVRTVEFSMGGSGLGSETSYWGVNYVPGDSTMVGFRGQQWDYWKAKGEGRLYYDPEGDNTCYVRKLAPCWYYYEMKF